MAVNAVKTDFLRPTLHSF